MDSTSCVFYTYIYLDPRKSGNYQFGNYTFEYEPFYVGKGKGRQFILHLVQAKNKNNDAWDVDNPYKFRKIRKILKEGFEIIKDKHILKVEINLQEQDAYDLEIWFVWAIGRSDLKLGPLTNLNDGGIGSFNPAKIVRIKKSLSMKGESHWAYGTHPSDETRKKLSDALKGKNNPMYGRRWIDIELEKLSLCKRGDKNSFYGKVHTKESIDKISKSAKGRTPWNKGIPRTEEEKKKMSESHKGKTNSPETRKKLSDALKGRFGTMYGKHHSSEAREKMSRSQKGRKHNSETIEKMKESRRKYLLEKQEEKHN